jgi:hypothetical protein
VAALASKQDIEDIKSTSWWGWDGGRQKGKREEEEREPKEDRGG